MNRHDLTQCTIEDGVLTIRIGVELIAHAAKLLPELTEYDDKGITSADQFAEEVLRQLKYEEEDGTTAVHRMFDEVIIEAIENGAEGIKLADDIIRARRKAAKPLSDTHRPEGK